MITAMAPYAILFFWLIVGHCLADYPLQGDFMAKAKSRMQPVTGFNWWIVMTAHCFIHAGAVAYVTGSVCLGLIEFVLHFIIDDLKTMGKTRFRTGQLLHVLCKILYLYIVIMLWPHG